MDFTQIALLLVLAASFGIVAKIFKQPVLVGYLFAGFLLSSLNLIDHNSTLEGLGQVGVTLLLFLVGLEVNIHELKMVGKASLVAGLGQIIFSVIIGFLISGVLGFGILPSIYIAIALTFSSTIIIIKLLSEKNDQDSLYGKISIGILLLQDVMAVLVLMFLSGLDSGGANIVDIFLTLAKAAILLTSVLYLSKSAIPKIFEKYVAHSQELLFVTSIAWAIGFASLVAGPLGLSYEVGGFLAGLAFANIAEHVQIAAKTRPLRDFFLTIFFLLLGSGLSAQGLSAIILPAIVLSIFVLTIKPFIVLTFMGLLGHRTRTSFMTSVTVAQISEFSFILMAMGASLGHISQNEVAIVVLTGAITMTASAYAITKSEIIYEKIMKYLSIFERKGLVEIELKNANQFMGHVVLVGGGRTGRSTAIFLKKKGIKVVVIDFSPDVYKSLVEHSIPTIFGDVGDPEVFSAAGGPRAKLIISTTSSYSDNLSILKQIKSVKPRPITILESSDLSDSKQLYKRGADYVISPRFLTGEYIRTLIKSHEGVSPERIKRMGRSHYKRIKLAL